MMFLLENSQVLNKHYRDIAPKYRLKELHYLIPSESHYLPKIDDMTGAEGIYDVGKEDVSNK